MFIKKNINCLSPISDKSVILDPMMGEWYNQEHRFETLRGFGVYKSNKLTFGCMIPYELLAREFGIRPLVDTWYSDCKN